MKALALVGSFLFATLVTSQAEARHHRHHFTHKFGHYLAWRHFHHHHHHYQFARHRQHRDVVHVGGLTKTKLLDGQTITVASTFAERFVGFFRDLFDRERRLPEIGCYAPTGHIRHSLHHWGGACDVGQTRRNVAWRPMRAIGDLARKWGLTDGCWWSNPDCGHVEVNRAVATIPALIALRHRRPHVEYSIALDGL